MSLKLNFNTTDFTEKYYKTLLKKIKNKTIFYNEINKYDNFTLWRHDIDFSVHRALSLAKLEKNLEVKATYFIQLGSNFYNIFEKETKNLIMKIIDFGHDIGLHFDFNQYNIENKKNFLYYLNYEKNIIEDLLKVNIRVFSFHNPNKNTLKYNNFFYSGMINTYAKYFADNVKYCSDSNGYWRFKRLEDFLEEKHEKIQVLTHPGWYQKEVMRPRERIIRSIQGRANNNLKKYDAILKKYARKNIK